MSPRSLITVTAVLLCVTLGLLSSASAARSKKASVCCTSFNRRPIPFENIRGFIKIPNNENCRHAAIIFLTKNRRDVCAKPEDEWVKKILERLSLLLKKMAKPAGRPQTTQSANPSFSDGSGSFSSTTEALTNSSEGYYY